MNNENNLDLNSLENYFLNNKIIVFYNYYNYFLKNKITLFLILNKLSKSVDSIDRIFNNAN
jgi:NADH:ubiquinone oxidoreductase subunit C